MKRSLGKREHMVRGTFTGVAISLENGVQEWTTPPPSRRPDPLPEFEKLETPPPRKMPGDPEQPDEEEEEEKKKEKPEEDPEEQPEAPPSEE